MTSENGYLRRFHKYGVDARALKWQSQKAAHQRYQEIVSLVNFDDKSILDVGCGFGDIIPFIAAKAKNFSYTGIDLVGEFLMEAKKTYPQHIFVQGDYFAKPLKKKFDIVIANGSLNSNLADNLGFRKKAITTMLAHAKEVVIFNMAGGHPQPKTAKDSNVWFANSLEIGGFCKELNPKVILINHPGRREFTVMMTK